jgi:nitronate monooxygenase
MLSLRDLEQPIVQAPMAGGPSTPALAAAVARAGGLGVLAAGYKTPDALRDDIAALRALDGRPFAVNVFAPPGDAPPDAEAVARYRETLGGEAARQEAELGEARHDDDHYDAKLELLLAEAPAAVSFTFGCPSPEVVGALHDRDVAAWVTVTTAAEATAARTAGADALVVQGAEAGGHRGTWDDAAPGDVGLLALLQLVRDAADLPLVAAGGLMTGAGVAAALAAGADAAALGTALLLAPEAATSEPQRAALDGDAPTALTRAFSGRTARGIVNRFLREHDAGAPSAYPDVHHVTSPLRAAARARGDADAINLWAGQAYPLARAEAAEAIVRRIAADARAALAGAATRWPA